MNNKQVAHEWAAQQKPHAKGSHFYFEGPSIFSYGSHFEIARFIRPDLILFTSRTYSNTTARHIHLARMAIPSNVQIFEVPHVDAVLRHNALMDSSGHKENVEYFIKQMEFFVERTYRARTNTENYINSARALQISLGAYLTEFKLKKKFPDAVKATTKDLFGPEARAELKKKIERDIEQAKKRKQERQEREERENADIDARLEQWADGEDVSKEGFFRRPPRLRIEHDLVVSSHGAEVALREASLLWGRFNDGENIIGKRVGSFEIREIGADYIQIGCHKISRTDLIVLFG